MTDIGSCKTCRYFDSKDWDSETKNWCRYNDLPAIYEGLCGHYEPMIITDVHCDKGRICPKCGKVMILCEDEKTYYQIWECDGCGHKEDE